MPCGSRNQHVGSTDLSRQISPSVPKQEPFSTVDIHQGVSRRSLINTAPLSPNHYGSILAQTSLPFRINRRSQLSGSRKTSVLTNANEVLMRPEREISADIKELQQKKQKIQVYDKLMDVGLRTKLQTEPIYVGFNVFRKNASDFTV